MNPTRVIVVLLLSIVGSRPIAGQDIVAGRQLVVFAAEEEVTCLESDYGMKCKDCQSGLVCGGSTVPLGTTNCPSTNPFCDANTNTCTSDQPAICKSSFICPAVDS